MDFNPNDPEENVSLTKWLLKILLTLYKAALYITKTILVLLIPCVIVPLSYQFVTLGKIPSDVTKLIVKIATLKIGDETLEEKKAEASLEKPTRSYRTNRSRKTPTWPKREDHPAAQTPEQTEILHQGQKSDEDSKTIIFEDKNLSLFFKQKQRGDSTIFVLEKIQQKVDSVSSPSSQIQVPS